MKTKQRHNFFSGLIVFTLLLCCACYNENPDKDNEEINNQTSANTELTERYYPLKKLNLNDLADFEIYRFIHTEYKGYHQISLEIVSDKENLKESVASFYIETTKNEPENIGDDITIFKNGSMVDDFFTLPKKVDYGTLEFTKVNAAPYMSWLYGLRIVKKDRNYFIGANEIGYWLFIHSADSKSTDPIYLLTITDKLDDIKIKKTKDDALEIKFYSSEDNSWSFDIYDIKNHSLKHNESRVCSNAKSC